MTLREFAAALELIHGKLALALPFDPNQAWGEKTVHHITGRVDGVPIRGPLAQEGGRYLLVLNPSWLREHPLSPGAVVQVIMEAEGPQSAALAGDITAALEQEPQAKAFFDALATFYRKKYLRWIDGARAPDRRAARIAEMISLLKAGKKQRE